ncbi:MAG TPA: MBL fold metallo-hydrolase, partial [Pseudogracilibacillus sp.]|nr:MBL fold metallo-hydrolase [Pseudogracilibacillus sp.]
MLDLFETSNVKLKFHTLSSGYCKQFEKFIRSDGKWKFIKIPALCFYLEHPLYGSILFDTGYSKHFFKATRKFPYRFYRYATPVSVSEEESIVSELKRINVDVSQIDYIVLSHFHADHIGAVKLFPNAQFIYLPSAYEELQKLNKIKQTKVGFVPDLLPEDFLERSIQLNERQTVSLPETFPFPRGIDVFADGSIMAVDLPGHAVGQIGIIFQTKDRIKFLCADAVWESIQYKKQI